MAAAGDRHGSVHRLNEHVNKLLFRDKIARVDHACAADTYYMVTPTGALGVSTAPGEPIKRHYAGGEFELSADMMINDDIAAPLAVICNQPGSMRRIISAIAALRCAGKRSPSGLLASSPYERAAARWPTDFYAGHDQNTPRHASTVIVEPSRRHRRREGKS